MTLANIASAVVFEAEKISEHPVHTNIVRRPLLVGLVAHCAEMLITPIGTSGMTMH